MYLSPLVFFNIFLNFGFVWFCFSFFFGWQGVDHVSVDNCGIPGKSTVFEYVAIHDALLQVGKPMVFGIWSIGKGNTAAWANKLGHYWRTASDVGNRWGQTEAGGASGHAGVVYNYDVQQSIPSIAAKSGPGSFAFMDQLMIGQVPGVPHGPGDTGLTMDEAKTHFALWCIMASPLWITYDIFNPPPGIHAIVTHPEAIAINQDSLGQMAVRIDGNIDSPQSYGRRIPGECSLRSIWPNGEQVARPLANGDFAVVLFNRLDSNLTITLDVQDVGDSTVQCFFVRNVWKRIDLGFFSVFEAQNVPSHGNVFLRLTPANATSCGSSPPPPPAPMPPCPAGFAANREPGYWQNTDPCPRNGSNGSHTQHGVKRPSHTQHGVEPSCKEDLGVTVEGCAKKCSAAPAADCVAFELFEPGGVGACYLFHKRLEQPFVPNSKSLTCLKN